MTAAEEGGRGVKEGLLGGVHGLTGLALMRCTNIFISVCDYCSFSSRINVRLA